MLLEYPDRIEPGGLAISSALAAAPLGHVGIPISRIGQDRQGDTLIQLLRERGVNIDHFQYDPDLPTGRLSIRTIAGRTTTSLTPRAAFDNLQWDFDLVDVAQQADGVVFGQLARRSAQTQSIIKRFLAECSNALRVFDLTNREDDSVDRADARSGLEYAEGLIVDTAALRILVPSWSDGEPDAAITEAMRGTSLVFAVFIERSGTEDLMLVRTRDADDTTWRAPRAYPSAQHTAATVGLIHGLLSGWDIPKSLEMAVRLAEHAASRPTEPLSPTL